MPYSYPLMIDLEYRLLGRGGAVQAGCGRTVTLSSTRVQFECADYLPEQSKVEISIVWPVRLDNGVGLKLCIVGRTVFSPDHLVVVEIQRYEFRTRSQRARGINAPATTSLRASAAVT
jgi:hypothetical protein